MICQSHTALMVVLVALGASLFGCAIPPAITPHPTQDESARVVPPQRAQVLWTSIDSSRVVHVHMYEVPDQCDTALANFVGEGFRLSRRANGQTMGFRIVKWIGIEVETQMVSCILLKPRPVATVSDTVDLRSPQAK
jgi:hypothetical protein